MTVIRTIPRKSRLSSLIDKPGGVSVGVARRQAQSNLDVMKPRAMALILERIEGLAAVPEPQRPDDALPARVDAYRLASEIIDAAGMFEMSDLCDAARGLCDLLDAAPEADDPFDWRVVDVHARSLKLLTTLAADATEERSAILEHLSRVVEHKLGLQSTV